MWISLWVEFKCPICNQDLEDDRELANFMMCPGKSHGLIRYYTGDGCYFTLDQKAAEALIMKGRRVHVADPKGSSTIQLE